jgi:lathosterol oxidase
MFIERILYSYSYIQLYFLTTAYFLLLYVGLAPLFLYACKVLHRSNLLQKIAVGDVSREQIRFEMSNSVRSILIFGFSVWPLIYLIRQGIITLIPNSVLNVLVGLLILTVWNEIHFFVVHRIMHLRYFMQHVHAVHHRSVVPTVYSVYSFHWFEALLLSTVPLTIAPFVSFSPLAIALYPLASILLNYAGHCNYRFGEGTGPSWKILGTRHAEHHFRRRKNYGFATPFLDWLHALYTHKKQ